MPTTPPVVLSIAGYDPSSGAGVTADIKTIAAHGCYGITCVTALTIQTTQGVSGVEPVRGKVVRRTLEDLASDFGIAAVRIGMLGSGEVASAVADFLELAGLKNVVLDPVVKSSSGAELIDAAGIEMLKARILKQCEIVTPNVDEAVSLTGVNDTRNAARKLQEMGARAVVVTGGHLNQAIDLLHVDGDFEELKAPKIQSRSTHGTGCAFATSIACGLAKGNSVRDAVISAKAYVRDAIQRAYPIGKGTGPLNHLHGKD